MIVLLCLGVGMASAQEVYNSSGKAGYHKKTKKTKGYDPDKLILGGGLNAGFGGGYANAGAAPIVGYRFTHDFSAGVGLGYQYYRAPQDIYDINDPNKTLYVNENIVYPSIWARYTVYRSIFVVANFEYDFISVKQYDYFIDPTTSQTYLAQHKLSANVACLPLGVGLKQPLGGRVSFIGELMYDVLQQKYSPYFGQPIIRLGIAAGL